MSEKEINHSRRKFLIGATSVVGGLGAVGAAVPFVKSWVPSAKARAAGAPIKVDISKLEPGQLLGPIPAWRGKPIFVMLRSPEVLKNLEKMSEVVHDPDSTKGKDQQPEYAQNVTRSRKPELLLVVGLCTHLGCSPKFYPKVQPEPFDKDWQGGFFCPCHGSKFDLAGRVYKGVPAPTNLEVPPHMYETDNIIVVGVDEETA